MSNLGVFHWIRESVKRSVLLGFSDAVEQLGVPSESQEVSPQLMTMLRQNSQQALENTAPAVRPQAKPERRRLGRSLDQIRDAANPAS